MSDKLRYKNFVAKIETDAENGIVYACIVNANSQLVTHSESMIDIKNKFHQLVDDYLKVCDSTGEPPFKSYSGKFNVRIGGNLHRWLAVEASTESKSLNEFIIEALTYYKECRTGFCGW